MLLPPVAFQGFADGFFVRRDSLVAQLGSYRWMALSGQDRVHYGGAGDPV